MFRFAQRIRPSVQSELEAAMFLWAARQRKPARAFRRMPSPDDLLRLIDAARR